MTNESGSLKEHMRIRKHSQFKDLVSAVNQFHSSSTNKPHAPTYRLPKVGSLSPDLKRSIGPLHAPLMSRCPTQLDDHVSTIR